MKLKGKKLVTVIVVSVITLVFVALDVLSAIFGGMITEALRPDPDFSGVEQTLEESDALCRKLAEDSIVLLRNENNALPLKETETKVNLFGVSAYDPSTANSYDGFLMKGYGSGSSSISESKAITLEGALTLSGIEYNPQLKAFYDGFKFHRGDNSDKYGYDGSGQAKNGIYYLDEPDITDVKGQLLNAKKYADVAIVVFSRLGGENSGEQPKTQVDNADKTYLEISDKEEALLKAVTDTFNKVIVLLNTTNTMHVGFLEEYDVSAAMYVGIPGQSGAVAIGEILKGQTLAGEKFSPSGKVSDTYVYTPDYDPSFANAEHSLNSDKGFNIQYSEGIYFGYRWYETAAKEGFLNYDEVVQYPFGFGLSYTTFDWEVLSVSKADGSAITDANKNEEIKVEVLVTNTGDYPGKDVVQLYYTPPYYKGGIEKTEVNLVAFEKTGLLQKGQSSKVTLTFTPYDIASFDDYDRNGNGKATYELDHGDYTFTLRSDSHTLKGCEDDTWKYTIANGTTVLFDKDPVTESEVTTRFTGENAYAGVPMDGSTAGVSQKYLSRADLEGTFPREKAAAATDVQEIKKAAEYFYTGYDEESEKTQGSTETSYKIVEDGNFNYDLIQQLAEDYDSELWEKVLNQVTVSELINVVHYSGFGSPEIASVGKPEVAEIDGPAGFNKNTQKGPLNDISAAKELWTSFPSESLIGCSFNKALLLEMGLSMGKEGNQTHVSGWYAPGINLHRTNYTSRNFEYYGEDAVLSGYLAANVILGAKYNGLNCYMKHFVLSESGPNGGYWTTWCTEQALREVYCRPFEIAVKKGGANCVMSSFNRVGATWAGANKALLTDVLRNEWGFRGTVLTDWSNGGPVGGMNPRQGVRAGNDVWLNGSFSKPIGPISQSDKIDVICARNSVHNVLYSYVDTVNFNHTADKSALDANFIIEMAVVEKGDTFRWWIIVLVFINVTVVAACGYMVYSAFFKKTKVASEDTIDVSETLR